MTIIMVFKDPAFFLILSCIPSGFLYTCIPDIRCIQGIRRIFLFSLQGTESQIDQVILVVERGTYVHIENMDVCTIPLVDGEHGFRAVAY